jgi:flavin reductase (DIM6/NTAB) family NADH-FMN oxidoreductase RutF
VLVSANRSTTAGAMALACDAFTINLLSEAQRSIAERFAAPHESRGDVFAATPHRLDPEGAALFDGALGAFSGRVRSLVDAGDHVLVLLDVTRIRVARASTAPLLYVDRAFCRVGDRL